jgi:hypothetical protein
MKTVFLEVVVRAAEAAGCGIESRDEIEGPLEDALTDAGLGEVTGAGGGSGVYVIDIEVSHGEFDRAIDLIKATLAELKVPPTTHIKRRDGERGSYPIYS